MASGRTTVVEEPLGYRARCTCVLADATEPWRSRLVMSVHAARNQARMHAEQEGCNVDLPPLSEVFCRC